MVRHSIGFQVVKDIDQSIHLGEIGQRRTMAQTKVCLMPITNSGWIQHISDKSLLFHSNNKYDFHICS